MAGAAGIEPTTFGFVPISFAAAHFRGSHALGFVHRCKLALSSRSSERPAVNSVLAGAAGIEPTTFGFGDRRSTD